MLDFTELLPLLNHSGFRSGEELAAQFNVTRGTIHNCILRIESSGIDVERVPGKGYRLVNPLDLLVREDILSHLDTESLVRMEELHCLTQVDSTNEFAAGLPDSSDHGFTVVTAEMQSAGRGRRGRVWVSPYAANIYLSIVWPFGRSLHEASVVSPFLAICLVEKLHALGFPNLGLKWPNDIYCNRKKLAGLLIECSGELGSGCKMIIGLGVNVAMSRYSKIEIDQQWTDVLSNFPGWQRSRSEFVADLVNCVAVGMQEFEGNGVKDLVNRWKHWDLMYNRSVTIQNDKQVKVGVARGIDAQGCLLLETNNHIESISVGDVTLRTQT